MNVRTPLLISLAIVAAMLAASVWTLTTVGSGAQVPIHWSADAHPDRFAPAWYGVFMAPAITALIAFAFTVFPWLEPRRLNLEQSAKAYRAIWLGVILFLAFAHGVALYVTLHPGAPTGSLFAGAVSLLMAVFGNYLGKTRSMFWIGIRTPWTLSSEYSWQRTHSIGGKLFMAAGVLGLAAALSLPAKEATHVLLYALGGTAVLSVMLSYVFWLRDPERRAGGAAS